MEKDFKEAELKKLRAETALLEMQLAEQKAMLKRGKFSLKLKSIIQAIVAGFILAGAFFFIFQPIVASYKAISDEEFKVASLKAEQGILKAKIQEEKNLFLEKSLTVENVRIRKELKSLENISRSIEEEKLQSAEVAREIERKFTNLKTEYEKLARESATSKSEKKRYESLAKNTQEQVEALELQVATLESDSQGAASRTRKLQEILDTREITGTRVYVGYYKGSEKVAKPLIAKLKSLGAFVSSSLNKQSMVLEKYRNKNSLLQPTLPDRGEQQLLEFARSKIEIKSILNEDLPSFREPTQILLYK